MCLPYHRKGILYAQIKHNQAKSETKYHIKMSYSIHIALLLSYSGLSVTVLTKRFQLQE